MDFFWGVMAEGHIPPAALAGSLLDAVFWLMDFEHDLGCPSCHSLHRKKIGGELSVKCLRHDGDEGGNH